MVPAMLKRGNRLRQWSGTQNAPLPAVVTFLMLLFVILLFLFGSNKEKSTSSSDLVLQKWNSFDYLIKLDPTVEFRNETDVIWQIPDSPKAVLFFAHGCLGKAANFWDKSPNCPKCVGLPEERLIVLHALARKFAVLTISSAGKCWSLGEERFVIKDIIMWWIAKQKLEKLPLVALGASSGGQFVSLLAVDLKFSSITLMISEGMFGYVDVQKSYPPTLFMHMPKDESRRLRIERYIILLKEKGIDVAEIKCTEFPLTPNFLGDRIPGLGQPISSKLFALFKKEGFIDDKGFMKKDGRAVRWKQSLQKSNFLLPDKSLACHIQEELNLAFAYHEMTSLQSYQIFDWFESHFS